MGRVERQARRDQLEEEAGAEQLRLMSRSLTEVAWEAMQQGHRIRLTWSGGETQGVPSTAVDDLVVLPVEHGVDGDVIHQGVVHVIPLVVPMGS